MGTPDACFPLNLPLQRTLPILRNARAQNSLGRIQCCAVAEKEKTTTVNERLASRGEEGCHNFGPFLGPLCWTTAEWPLRNGERETLKWGDGTWATCSLHGWEQMALVALIYVWQSG